MNRVTLGDICEKASSNIVQKDLDGNEGEYPIYGASGYIKNVNFYHQTEPYIAIVKDGAGIGRTMLLPAKSSVIGTMQYILPKEDKDIDIDYLYYAIVHMNLGKYFSGATIPHIYFKDYQKESLNLPDRYEQQHIASIFKKIDVLISNTQEQTKHFDELIKARFVEMFGNPFNCPKWGTEQLSVLAKSISDGSNVDKQYYKKYDSVLFLRIQNVWFNELRLEDSVYISDAVNKSYFDTSLHKGDLLITKIGRYYTNDSSLGRVSVYLGDDDKANYSNNIMRVRLCDRVDSEFVNALMNLDDYNKYIRKVSVGGTDKRALSKKVIGELPIIVPPKQLQEQYVELLHQVDKSKLVLEKRLQDLEILKKSLMQQYFG